ncbi:hypothetical protein [Maribacter sp. 2210JD10-5]|uniref:hypothetical protein n=1 Tax=Maribacter sp. 2210JD10-5 TaxID=3386272 RepID=UPI0039BC51E3
MKMPFKLFLVFFLCCASLAIAQNKYEREFRIRKSQFPEKAIALIKEKLEGAKRLKFYKEIDSLKSSFEAKFKKDRLWYSVEFDENGVLEDIEILIKPIDVPTDTFGEIENFLKRKFSKYRIKRLQQQYPTSEDELLEETVKKAFQNLIVPSVNYEIIVSGKNEKGHLDYEILFDAQGEFVKLRQSLPPNYDHVLY